MQITANTTPFLADLFVPVTKAGVRHCCVVVKGSFEVAEDGIARPAEEQQPLVYSDQHHGDPGSTSVRYECEFVPCKPRVDVLVNGAAVASDGKLVDRLPVALMGPGLRKQADLWGDRIWIDGVRGIHPSPPRPFVRLPLRWERAFGGSDHRHP